MIRSNSGGSAITKSRIKSTKAGLILSSVCAMFLDAVLFALCIISGIKISGFPVWIIPFMLLLLSFTLVVSVSKSNFRYVYSLIIPAIYAVVTLVISAVFVVITSVGSEVFSKDAKVLFFAIRILVSILILFSSLLGVKIGKGAKAFTLLMFLLLTATAVYYGVFVIGNGLFGQGQLSYRPAIYLYDEDTDSYTVKEFASGKAEKAFIPKEFNAKPVLKIEDKAFTDKNLRSVEFEDGTQVTFNNKMPSDVKTEIIVDYAQFNEFKDLATKTVKDNDYSQEYLNFYNAIQPKNVSGKFITFAYSKESFELIEGKPIHAWFGAQGDVFNIEDFSDGYDYVKYSDTSSERALFESYSDNGYVLIKPSINGLSVNQNTKKLNLAFEQIYKLRIGDSNDTKYIVSDSVKNPFGTGYRYVINSTANDLTKLDAENGIVKRDGFNLSWTYTYGDIATQYPLDKLSNNLKLENLIIYPIWDMQAPTVENVVLEDTGNDGAVYGDQITLKLSAPPTHSADGVTFSYQWKRGEEILGGEECYVNNLIRPQDSSNYILAVTAKTDKSSLEKTAFISYDLSVAKKQLKVEWIKPENAVYTGAPKIWSATVSGMVGSDVVTLDKSISAPIELHNDLIDAGDYLLRLSLGEQWGELYTLSEDQVAYTIQKADMTVTWEDTEKVYNGQVQYPTAYYMGVVGLDGNTPIIGKIAIDEFDKSVKNAGTHTLTAKIYDGNYNFSDVTNQFVITPYQAEVIWDTSKTLTYNGYEQAPQAYIAGLGTDGRIYTQVMGGTDAGTHTASASVNNTNYTLTNQTKEYTIEKKSINVIWSQDILVYNGSEQTPKATVSGVKGQSLGLQVTGGAINAGTNYTAIARLTDAMDKNNYTLENTVCEFGIEKKRVTVVWANTEFTYDGQKHIPTATVNENGLSIHVLGGQITAGQHTATAKITNSSDINNYLLENDTVTFTIIEQQTE